MLVRGDVFIMCDKYIEFNGIIGFDSERDLHLANKFFMDDVIELVEAYKGQLFMFSKVKEELFADEDDYPLMEGLPGYDLQKAFEMLEDEGHYDDSDS